MDSNTVIREMAAGQMPMEIPTVPGMMKTIIPEHSWKSMNSRAAVYGKCGWSGKYHSAVWNKGTG